MINYIAIQSHDGCETKILIVNSNELELKQLVHKLIDRKLISNNMVLNWQFLFQEKRPNNLDLLYSA